MTLTELSQARGPSSCVYQHRAAAVERADAARPGRGGKGRWARLRAAWVGVAKERATKGGDFTLHFTYKG